MTLSRSASSTRARRKATRPERGHVSAELESKRRRARSAAGNRASAQTELRAAAFHSANSVLRLLRPVEVGVVLKVGDVFTDVKAVDVTGTSKGRGTTGCMKRHGFAGLPPATRKEAPPLARQRRLACQQPAAAAGPSGASAWPDDMAPSASRRETCAWSVSMPKTISGARPGRGSRPQWRLRHDPPVTTKGPRQREVESSCRLRLRNTPCLFRPCLCRVTIHSA